MKKHFIAGSVVAVAMALSIATVAHAATTVVVTPSNSQGWTTDDTRVGGAVNFVADATAPLGTGALQLTTDSTNAAKAQYMLVASAPLSSVTELAYSTKQVSGPSFADASYQLQVDLNGAATGGFTTFVYEPYENGTVVPGAWQTWDVDAGQFWSSKTFSEGSCSVVAGAGGAPYYTLSGLQAACPDAVVVGYGVNIGSYNPSYDVYADALVFNGTTYDFELVTPEPPVTTPNTKDECKNGGWKTFNPAFKNQGQCVSSVARNK
jgi:hypothetical protein